MALLSDGANKVQGWKTAKSKIVKLRAFVQRSSESRQPTQEVPYERKSLPPITPRDSSNDLSAPLLRTSSFRTKSGTQSTALSSAGQMNLSRRQSMLSDKGGKPRQKLKRRRTSYFSDISNRVDNTEKVTTPPPKSLTIEVRCDAPDLCM